jgi:hypothetical protein
MLKLIGIVCAAVIAVAAAGCSTGMKDDGMMKNDGMTKDDSMKKDRMMK